MRGRDRSSERIHVEPQPNVTENGCRLLLTIVFEWLFKLVDTRGVVQSCSGKSQSFEHLLRTAWFPQFDKAAAASAASCARGARVECA